MTAGANPRRARYGEPGGGLGSTDRGQVQADERVCALITLLLPLLLDAPTPAPAIVCTLTLESMPYADLLRLQGQRRRFKVSLDSQPLQSDGFTVYEVRTADPLLNVDV
jgi:hypothetical protein